MPLRTVNEREPIQAALQALATIMPANTALAAAGGTVVVESLASLIQGAQVASGNVFPALLLEEGAQSRARIAFRTWQQKATLVATYFNRWDQRTVPNEQIWADMDTDIRRMLANLEDNPTLTISGAANALDIARVDLSPFAERAVDRDSFGFPVVQRFATIAVNFPPYLSVG